MQDEHHSTLDPKIDELRPGAQARQLCAASNGEVYPIGQFVQLVDPYAFANVPGGQGTRAVRAGLEIKPEGVTEQLVPSFHLEIFPSGHFLHEMAPTNSDDTE